jgi:hypothetical protein
MRRSSFPVLAVRFFPFNLPRFSRSPFSFNTDQLFFSDPTSPDIVYADSEVFAIGTPDVGAAPLTPLLSSSLASSTASSDPSAVTSVTTTTTALVKVTASPTSAGQIVAATVPGGPAEQGFNLIKSGAGALSINVAGVMGVVGAAAVLMAV